MQKTKSLFGSSWSAVCRVSASGWPIEPVYILSRTCHICLLLPNANKRMWPSTQILPPKCVTSFKFNSSLVLLTFVFMFVLLLSFTLQFAPGCWSEPVLNINQRGGKKTEEESKESHTLKKINQNRKVCSTRAENTNINHSSFI